MYMMAAVKLLSEFIEEMLEKTKGSTISLSVKQIGRWYEKKYMRAMPRKTAYRIAKVLNILLAQGALQAVGRKRVLEKDSPLWRCAKEQKTYEYMLDVVVDYKRRKAAFAANSATNGSQALH